MLAAGRRRVLEVHGVVVTADHVELLSFFVAESNRIEGIRGTTDAEVEAHRHLLGLSRVDVSDLEEFVSIIAPGNVLRDRPGYDVRVGDHVPPRGGPEIRLALEAILRGVNIRRVARSPYEVHQQYETLHPFTDGNGRSGRALWAWQMLREDRWPGIRLGFLHCWYYQSLQASR